MANYEINLTASQIEAALNKAHAPQTSITNTQNLVEAQAVKAYVDSQLAGGAAITTSSFASGVLETTITDTDTSIPTSGAVFDAVANATPQVAIFNYTGISSLNITNAGQGSLIPPTELSDLNNIAEVSQNSVTVSPGSYLLTLSYDIYDVTTTGSNRETQVAWYTGGTTALTGSTRYLLNGSLVAGTSHRAHDNVGNTTSAYYSIGSGVGRVSLTFEKVSSFARSINDFSASLAIQRLG